MKENNKKITEKIVKAVNKNVRSSTRKLKPILKSIVGKKVDIVIEICHFQIKEFQKMLKKLFLQLYQMLKIIFSMIQII